MCDRLLLWWIPPGARFRGLRASVFLLVEFSVTLPLVALELFIALVNRLVYRSYRRARYGVVPRRVVRWVTRRPMPPGG